MDDDDDDDDDDNDDDEDYVLAGATGLTHILSFQHVAASADLVPNTIGWFTVRSLNTDVTPTLDANSRTTASLRACVRVFACV